MQYPYFQDELNRLTQRDARSLYIRFAQNNLPSSPEEIKKLHSDIKFVRAPRLDPKGKRGINYVFVEFGSEAECKAAKIKLATTQFQGSELFVDFVGEKSRTKKARDGKDKAQFNPSRLFISGLAAGVTKSNLKAMFPKCSGAEIPSLGKKKGTAYGFVQFSTPSDAKAAFDAAQDLEVAGHPITVLFAKRTAEKDEVLKKKKAEKRKIKEEKKLKLKEEKKAKKPKIVKDSNSGESENVDDDNKENEEDNDSSENEDADDSEEEEAAADTEKEDEDDNEDDSDGEGDGEEENVEGGENENDEDDEDDDDDNDESEGEDGEENKESADNSNEDEDDDDDDDDEDDED